jgi:hypothetical protein
MTKPKNSYKSHKKKNLTKLEKDVKKTKRVVKKLEKKITN